MTILCPNIAARLFNTPLMIAPEKAADMLIGLGGRVVEGGVVLVNPPPPAMGKLGDRMGRSIDRAQVKPYDVVDGVAVIGVEGTLVHKGAFIGQSSGQTSYQGLQVQITRAANDPDVRGVVFEVDSFGGQANGAFETADAIAALSRKKPTMAILTDFALSGGYLLASQCGQIVMPKEGAAGSIGVVVLHADFSGALEKDGIKVTIMAAGKHKADGNPYEPLPDEVRDATRARIEACRQDFAAHAAKGRKARLTKAQALATEAKVYHGAEAVAAGLVDAIGPANAAFQAFVRAVNNRA